MHAVAQVRGARTCYMLRILSTNATVACCIAASPILGMHDVVCHNGEKANILSREFGTAGVLTGNGFCLQLCCEQSRVFLRFPELRVLMRKEADSASACEPIRATLQHKRVSAESR